MIHRPRISAIRALAAVMALASAAAVRSAVPFNATLSPLRDITVVNGVVSRDMDVLKSISSEFAQSYRFASSKVYYKEPGLFRVDSKAGAMTVRYIINGNTKSVKAGVINQKKNIAKEPAQRQGAMTVGLLTPDWANLVNVKPAGERKIGGVTASVFEARYKADPGGGHFIIAMHPTMKYIMRYERWYSDGRMKNAMEFMEPKKLNGVWVPMRTKVFNGSGTLGAVTEVKEIKVNAGLADSLFKI